MVKLDIFDEVADEKYVFDEVESTEESSIDSIGSQVNEILKKFDDKERKRENTKITEDLKSFIREEISKIKPVQNVIEKVIETKVIEPKAFHIEPRIVEAPPQIIKEVTHEVRIEIPTEKKDERKFVELSVFQDLLVKFVKVQNQLKEVQRMAESPIVLGGSGVIGIPPPEPNPQGYVLTVNAAKKAEWKASTGGGGSSPDVYTTANVTTTTNIDPTTSSIDDLYNVVASLIVSLQGAGIIQ